MPRRIRTGAHGLLTDTFLDFKKGLIADLSDAGLEPNYLKRCDNVVFEHLRGMSSRHGYQALNPGSLPVPAHSIFKFYPAAPATSQTYVGAGSAIYRATSSTYTAQDLSALGTTLTGKKLVTTQINGQVVVTEENGIFTPFFWDGTSWLSAAFPKPAAPVAGHGGAASIAVVNCSTTGSSSTVTRAAGNFTTDGVVPGQSVVISGTTFYVLTVGVLTLTVNGTPVSVSGATLTFVGVAGSVDAGAHNYRLRWRFKNGSSQAPNSVGVTTGANESVTIMSIPTPSPARSDYLGWSLERTKVGFPNLWYFVASGTANFYVDSASDASLGELIGAETPTAPGAHGDFPASSGVTTYRNRTIAWSGSALNVSQVVGDAEFTGAFNFNALNQILVAADDGDIIKTCIPQGDRLMIFKEHSIWALHGFDPTTFQLVQIQDGIGTPSIRGADSVSSTVWFYGGADRLFRIVGSRIERMGDHEVSPYFQLIPDVAEKDVVVRNKLNEYILVAYTSTPSTVNNEVIAYHLSHRNFTHWTNIRIADGVAPRRRDEFNGEEFLWADPLQLSPSYTTPDASSPTYFTWVDNRSGTQNYVQRVSSNGVLSYPNGLLLGANTTGTLNTGFRFSGVLGLVSGDFICCWIENRGGPSIFVTNCSTTGTNSTVTRASGSFTADGVVVGQTVSIGPTAFSVASVGVLTLTVIGTPTAVSGVSLTFSGAINHVFANRFNAAGAKQWGAGDVLVNVFTSYGGALDNASILICSDGTADGCIIAWEDYRNGTAARIYAQRLDGTGAALWAANGKVVSNTSASVSGDRGDQLRVLLPDGSNGAFFAWSKDTETTTPPFSYQGQAYIQRLDASGNLPAASSWIAGGIPGPVTGPAASHVDACRDGSGGLFLATCYTGGLTTNIRHFNSSGSILWNSANLQNTATSSSFPRIVPDGSGGCILAWFEGSGTPRIYVRRLLSTGAFAWNPILLTTACSSFGAENFNMSAVQDAAGGIFVGFLGRPAAIDSLFAAHIDTNGAKNWENQLMTTGGVSLQNMRIVADGGGGFICVGVQATPEADYYGRRINSDSTAGSWGGTDGQLILSIVGNDILHGVAFTATPTGEIPASQVASYHAWAGFSGTSDARPSTGTIGDPIPLYIETPPYDMGEPDMIKDFERLEVYVPIGVANVEALVKTDSGSQSFQFTSDINQPRWSGGGLPTTNSTLYWAPATTHPNNPHRWGGDIVGEFSSGIPSGVQGRRQSIVISAQLTTELVVAGFALDFTLLPDRAMTS